MREERPQLVVESDKVGVAPQYQPARVGDAIFDAQLEDSESGSLFHDFVTDNWYSNGDIIVVINTRILIGPAQFATDLRWPPAAFVHPLAIATASGSAGGCTTLAKGCRRLMGALDGQRPEANLGFGSQVEVVSVHGVTRRGPTRGYHTVEITFGLGEP